MNVRPFVLAAAATLLAAGAAAAQDADSTLTQHPNSFAVQLNSSPTIGLWHRFTPRVEAGVEVFARRQNEHYDSDQGGVDIHNTSIVAGPALKVYTAPAGPLQPYVYASAGVEFFNFRNEQTAQDGSTVVTRQKGHSFNAALALGLEWAPVERVRIGAHAGLEGTLGSGTTEFDYGDVDNDSSSLGTFTSGIRVQFYF